jgi:hypothetical protein
MPLIRRIAHHVGGVLQATDEITDTSPDGTREENREASRAALIQTVFAELATVAQNARTIAQSATATLTSAQAATQVKDLNGRVAKLAVALRLFMRAEFPELQSTPPDANDG